MICSVFGTAWWKAMKKEEVGKFVWAALITVSRKCLINLLIRSSFFFHWYGKRNIFSGKKKVSNDSSAKLKGRSHICFWKPLNFPLHWLVSSSAGLSEHPGVFLLFPRHREVTPYNSGCKLTSFKVVLSRSLWDQGPTVGSTAHPLHPKIRIFCSQMKGGGGWILCRQLG